MCLSKRFQFFCYCHSRCHIGILVCVGCTPCDGQKIIMITILLKNIQLNREYCLLLLYKSVRLSHHLGVVVHLLQPVVVVFTAAVACFVFCFLRTIFVIFSFIFSLIQCDTSWCCLFFGEHSMFFL